MSMIFVRRHSPIEIENETHSLLLIDYLTAAADIVDFTDYSYNVKVAHNNGIHLIWGNKHSDSTNCIRLKINSNLKHW